MNATTELSSPPPTDRSALRTARSALTLLREQAWLGALAGVIVLSVVFVFLGRWQYHRHEARTARNDLVNANYNAEPVTLSDLIPTVRQNPAEPLPGRLEWRPVTVEGTYLSDRTVLLRNRPHERENGYDVVVPLRTTEGPVLLVDRGWVPAGSTSAAEPDSLPPPPGGTVTVVARLRPSEEPTTRKAPAGQANRLAVRQLAGTLDPDDARQVVGGYGLLVSETPPPAQVLALSDRPDPGLGINFAYAVQWVAFAVAAYVLFGVALVREARRRNGEEPPPLRLPWRRRERDEYDEDPE
jgi:cytochrome oxidase assembly protein ShyY1